MYYHFLLLHASWFLHPPTRSPAFFLFTWMYGVFGGSFSLLSI